MAHSKQRDEIQPALGVIRDSFSAIGTGTLIRIEEDNEILRANGIHPGNSYLLVSNQGLEDIGSDDSLSVKFLLGNQKQSRAYGFSRSDCMRLPTFPGNGGCLPGLAVVPIENLDDQRNIVRRMLSSSMVYGIRGLSCNFERVAEAEVCDLTCRVLMDYPYETRPFYHRRYKVGVDEDGFFLKE